MTDAIPGGAAEVATVVLTTDLPLTVYARGKVRDTYRYGDDLLMIATDRISAYDVVMAAGIPRKGEALTALARYWFARTSSVVPNHLLPLPRADARMAGLARLVPDLPRRAMLVRRADRIDVECVVRGYLAGSGWSEYAEFGTLAGELLPAGVAESGPLPAPAFTPAIKNDHGHDENISRRALADLVGPDRAAELETLSVALYTLAAAEARARGVIIADTKFEFGLVDGRLTLIDEILTPDSSRFWPADTYRPGGPQPSLDKQPVRDYLRRSGWDRQPPGPVLPAFVVEDTTRRYLDAVRLLTGHDLDEQQ